MRIISQFSFVLAVLLAPAIQAHDYQHGSLDLVHPWIVEPPPGALTAAGYVAIFNAGGHGDRLLSVEAAFSERAEVHSMTMTDDGVMQMRPVEGALEIGIDGTLMLEPGGYHIMFMRLSKSLKEGEHHHVTLIFEMAGAVTLEFVVQRRDSEMGTDDMTEQMDMDAGAEMEMDPMAPDEEEVQ